MLNDNTLYLRLKEYYNRTFSTYKVDNVDNIYNVLSRTEEYIIITTECALNNVDRIRESVAKARFIIIVKELTENLKSEIFSKEIFNIIEGEEFLFQDLIENIETPRVITYKNKSDNLNNIILITGTISSGKTILSKLIGEILARKGKRTVVIDFSFLNPSLDIYTRNSSTYSIIDIIKDAKINKFNKVEVYENDSKIENLKYILNSKSINIPEEDIQMSILKYLSSMHEYVIVDTSTLNINMVYRISKTLNARIVFALEESIKGIREYYTLTRYIEKSELFKSMLILSRYNKESSILKYIREHIPLDYYGYINKNSLVNLYIKGDIKLFRYDIKKLIKKLKI